MPPMCRIFLWAGSIALGLVLGGCLPVTSSSPLGTTVAASLDPQLAGIWKGKLGASTESVYVAFYPGHDGVAKIVVLASPSAGDEGGWTVFEARGALLGDNTYLDAREIEDDGKAPDPRLAHVIILYKVGSDGRLALYLIDEDVARAAIGKGLIAGTIEPGEYGDVSITAAPPALDAFFASAAGRALFTKPLGILQRTN